MECKKLPTLKIEVGAERVIEAHSIVIYYMLLWCNFDALPGSRCGGYSPDDIDELSFRKGEARVDSILSVLVFTFSEAVAAVIHPA